MSTTVPYWSNMQTASFDFRLSIDAIRLRLLPCPAAEP